MGVSNRVFVSQRMRGRSEEAIDRERHLIFDALPSLTGIRERIEVPKLDKLTTASNSPASCVGLSIQDMANSDLVVFAPGWRDARGCVVEHAVCLLYGLSYIELLDGDRGYYISKDGRNEPDA